MDDRTIITTGTPERGFAYFFWVSPGIRGTHTHLRPDGVTFGTGPDADVVLPGAEAADEQARVRREGDGWFLYDLASNDTTLLNGAAIYREELASGSRIALAGSEAIFRALE